MGISGSFKATNPINHLTKASKLTSLYPITQANTSINVQGFIYYYNYPFLNIKSS